MIDRVALLTDLKKQVAGLERDLLERATDQELPFRALLLTEWEEARRGSRTAATYESWLADQVTRSAVAWVLGTVLLRFCEDNELIEPPYLAGPGERLALAEEREQNYLSRSENREKADREWIVAGFDRLGEAFPFDRDHDPMRRITPSLEASRNLVAFWRTTGADGRVVHDFTDPEWNTLFLGDLYQDLSEQARKTHALITTPDFIRDLILDLTLEPAVRELGLEPDGRALKLIDPVCGSGDFLLAAFRRLLAHWEEAAPALCVRTRIERVLSSVHGADKDPNAVTISRFRLLLEAMRAGGARTLEEVPGISLRVSVVDSLWREKPLLQQQKSWMWQEEDLLELVVKELESDSYHVVVGEPPYVTAKDKAESHAYRMMYPAATGMYALTVPFIQRFFDLAVSGKGFVGLFVANSFMKREFGRTLIEQFVPTVELSHVIDTSGAYIPGRGTPTVVLVGRNRLPGAHPVRTVVGLSGEPALPVRPEDGVVWRALREQLGSPGSQSRWVSVEDLPQEHFARHPWSLTDPSTALVLQEMGKGVPLRERVVNIGYHGNTGSDDLFTGDRSYFRRVGAEAEAIVPVVVGSDIRDWIASPIIVCLYLAKNETRSLEELPAHYRRLWPYRTPLRERPNYSGRTFVADGRSWFAWHHLTERPDSHRWRIVFPWVATHPHFALLKGDEAIALHSAPVIRLPKEASDTDVIQLTALLNSSAVCFWLKQRSQSKGAFSGKPGTSESWGEYFQFTSGVLGMLPLPRERWSADRWSRHAGELVALADQVRADSPAQVIARSGPSRRALDEARTRWTEARERMVALQEELDWEIYGRYGLVDEQSVLAGPGAVIPPIKPGERAFEIALARRAAKGESLTTWFSAHGHQPVTELPRHWPKEYRQVVERRLALLAERRDLSLLERPEHKRRWAAEPWEEAEHDALREWLLDWCEDGSLWQDRRPLSVREMTDRLADEEFLEALRLYRGQTGFDMMREVKELLESEHVPYLPALRYKEPGLRKHEEWRWTWTLQRREDAEGKQLEIPAPPKFTSADFLQPAYWRNRGKYDVPKERFISYPGASVDGSPLYGWTGWDHLQQGEALARLVIERQREYRWDGQELLPLLAGLAELLPWIRQWHGEVDPDYGQSPADAYTVFLEDQKSFHGFTDEDLEGWRPPKPRRGRPRRGERRV